MPPSFTAPASPGTQSSAQQLVGSFASLDERIAHLQWRKTCNEREIQGTLRLTKKLQERDDFLRISSQTKSKTKKLEWMQGVINDELHKPLPVTPKYLDHLDEQARALEKSQEDSTKRHMAQIKEIRSKLDEREAQLVRKKEFERKKKELLGGKLSS